MYFIFTVIAAILSSLTIIAIKKDFTLIAMLLLLFAIMFGSIGWNGLARLSS